MKAMIFAAGLGTRLKPITDSIPKALVEIGGQTLLERLMLKLKCYGIDEVVINVHHFPDQIINYLNANNGFGMSWAISDERNQLLETGGGLKKAQYLFADNEPILVHNVDIISNLDFTELFNAYSDKHLATLVVSKRETQRYLMFDDQLRLKGWKNFATGQTRPALLNVNNLQPLAFSGIQIVSHKIFDEMKQFEDKFSIIDVYLATCSKHIINGFVPTNYRMMDVGKINHITEAQSFVEHLAKD